uniref:Uncharacterized protein n=1 Tax=Anguilla anguilla TaxID=7936 RepID=A0A0E9U1M0_ANGAN
MLSIFPRSLNNLGAIVHISVIKNMIPLPTLLYKLSEVLSVLLSSIPQYSR